MPGELKLSKALVRRRATFVCLLTAGMGLGCLHAVAQPQGQIPPEAVKFFEERIRPVLSDKCYPCHTDMASGGLRLDSRDSLLRGGKSGPAIIPGKPEESLLIRAVSHTDPRLKMPLVGEKLKDQEIADLSAWIKRGAPWPAGDNREARHGYATAGEKLHWAFQPVHRVAVPDVKDKEWVKTPIDAYILAELEERGLRLSKTANRRTLIRRATYDLIGLPPTPAEVAAFESDSSAGAFVKVVDRLLASPHYGERWARHWLDVARYGETKGYTTVGLPEELRYPFAYTYRDWVIQAFNEDMPYDRFVTLQIAADYLVQGEDKRALAAMGFLTLGRRFANNTQLIIDDRLDVIFRGTQALTVQCARCHDHKFDPIPTKDYYSLYGVLAASAEKTLPLITRAEEAEKYRAYEEERKKREQAIKAFLEVKRAELLPRFRKQVGEYLLAARQAQMLRVPDNLGHLQPVMVERWRAYLEGSAERFDPVFAPWHAFVSLSEEEFAAKAPLVAKDFSLGNSLDKPLNPLVAKLFSGNPPTSLRDVAERYGQLFRDLEERWENSPAQKAEDPAEEQLRQVLYGEGAPTNVPVEGSGPNKPGIDVFLDEPSKDRLTALKRSLVRWTLSPTAPPHALALQDLPNPENPRVFVRGKPDNLGDEVPRQFLAVLSGPHRQPFKIGSGRLELAQAIASKRNPLTARVMVNRIWLWLMGAGLVRTPSDFGLRSERPTHPELLEFLAQQFMDEGWSIKTLIRLIMLSSVYQQSSVDNPENRLVDPENRLVGRMNRRRLDFESLRDSLLDVAGTLDTKMGGPSARVDTRPFTKRRTVYAFIDRDNLPAMFRAYDFAAPETHTPQRYNTTVPQQALFLMNSPFVIEQAQQLAKSSEGESPKEGKERIRKMYRVLYQRDPTPEEVQLGLRFVERRASRISHSSLPEPEIWQYGYGKFDEATVRIVGFKAFPYWTGESWQGGQDLPDPSLGRAMLSAEGGHPGPDLGHAVIRRWLAPRDGVITILGTFAAPPTFAIAAAAGDGVEGRIVSSSWGELGKWVVHNGFSDTKLERVEVKRGDAIDFVVDCRSNPYYDSFSWAPTIRMIEESGGLIKEVKGGAAATNRLLEWNAANDFSGPWEKPPQPLSAWEKYAQVLLMTNELLFVD